MDIIKAKSDRIASILWKEGAHILINFVQANKRYNLQFVREIIDRSTVNEKTGEVLPVYQVVIKIKNFDNGKSRIHRYTDFMNRWLNSSPKTAYDIAGYIVPFLNYVTFELSSEDLTSIQDLTFNHGIEYLEKLSERGSRFAVKHCENALKEFFYFLASKDLLNNLKKSDFTFVQMKNGKLVMKSPFNGKYRLPLRRTPKRLHQIENDLVFEFLLTAMQEASQIALGVYFQFFGGLRVSEVVNASYSNLHLKGPYGRNGMVVVLKKTRQRPDLKQDALTSPKKPRNQPILPIGNLLSTMYQNHIESFKNPNTDAIFLDTNGKPMSKSTYRYHFDNLKEAFIKKLKESPNPEYKTYSAFLKTQLWSTHIGRGVFSALVADMAQNASEIAVLRGDSDLRSALSYLSDSRRVESKLISNLNKFYSDNISARLSTTLHM